MAITKEDLKNKVIKIGTNEEWVLTQLILFSYGLSWYDTGTEIFKPEYPGYNIQITYNFKMLCYHNACCDYSYEDIKNM